MMKDKETLKSGLKLVVSQFQLITVILLFLLGTLGFISYLNNGALADTFDWFFPFQVFGISIPTSLCSFIAVMAMMDIFNVETNTSISLRLNLY